LKLCFINHAAVSTKEIEQIADLPPREILMAQLLGLIQAPATRLARMLNEPASSLARLLKAKSEKEGPPAAETAAT
jgi:large subunit ribosomal protein L10